MDKLLIVGVNGHTIDEARQETLKSCQLPSKVEDWEMQIRHLWYKIKL